MNNGLGKTLTRVVVVLLVFFIMPRAFGAVQAASTCPVFHGSDFTNPTVITNPYSPLKPETTLVYHGTFEHSVVGNVFQITEGTKVILGVTTVEVHDTVNLNGTLSEFTLDWFAQDKKGNVWYFGEFATEYENGVPVSHEGSWQAGQNGAQPGIIMEAHPHVGDTYCQENAQPVAQDKATVLKLNGFAEVPFGDFHGNVLVTREFSPLKPGVVENKFYAPGVGLIKAVMIEGGHELTELVALHNDDD